jgi:hypothetical protein
VRSSQVEGGRPGLPLTYESPGLLIYPIYITWGEASPEPYRSSQTIPPSPTLLRPNRHTIARTAGARIQSSTTERAHQISFPLSTCLLAPVASQSLVVSLIRNFVPPCVIVFVCFLGLPKTIGAQISLRG